MRIWLIHMGEHVQSDGPGTRLYRLGLLAEQLVERGHEVVRWIPTFVHTTKTYRSTADGVVRVGPRHEIRLIHEPGYSRHLGPGRLRFHRQVARRWESLQQGLPGPDLIVTSMPTTEICAAARRISRTRGVPYVIDVRDLWPDVLEESLPRVLRGPARIASIPMRMSNRRSFAGAAGITAISDEFVEWGVSTARRRRRSADAAFVPGYEPPRAVEEDVRVASEQWASRLPRGAFVCVFLGTLGPQFDLSPVVRAARELEREAPGRFAWVLCGEGPTRQRLAAEAADLENVHLPGWVTGADIVALLRLASVGLAPYTGDRHSSKARASRASFAQGLPNKPFEYASAGLPVVSSLHGKLGSLLVREGFGALYQHDDDASLSAVVREYAANPDLLAQQGAAGFELWRREFSAASVYKQMAEHLEQIGDPTCAPAGTPIENGQGLHT